MGAGRTSKTRSPRCPPMRPPRNCSRWSWPPWWWSRSVPCWMHAWPGQPALRAL